jgi:(S)-2-hydroxyglutarate dehydrogenase
MAQLVNMETKVLVMDFVAEGDTRSVPVLNAVSPVFTCSIHFTEWVIQHYVYKKIIPPGDTNFINIPI